MTLLFDGIIILISMAGLVYFIEWLDPKIDAFLVKKINISNRK